MNQLVMDRISELPEALLLRILSSLPAKNVVATMVLSKRWQFLWTLVPRLVYDDSYKDIEYGRFSRFVDRSLVFHEAPVLETLHFKLGRSSGADDVRVWIKAAENRGVRELIIHIDKSSSKTPATIPRSLYSGCRMLVTLKLNNAVLADASSSSPVSFPSLKTLSLVSVKYPGDEFVKSLLSSCPVLEDLHVRRCGNDNVTIFTIKVPFLKRISFLDHRPDVDKDGAHGLVIDAPSVEFFHIVDYSNAFCVIEQELPNIVEADIDIIDSHPGKILSSIVSVKRLILCLVNSKEAYPVGTVFHSLVHLRLCTCDTEWLNLLMCLLRDSPKLKSLKLKQCHIHDDHQLRPCWTEPSSVPECLLSSLETFTWEEYEGTQEEKEVAAFILRSASCLKKVTISSKATDSDKKLEMIKELSLSSRRSPTCQLAFD